MVKVQHFSESLEGNFRELGIEISRQKENPERAKLPEREIVKHAIQSIAVTDPEEVKREVEKKSESLPSYLLRDENPDLAKEVEDLVTLAFQDGIVEAVKKARKHPPFVEDALHDALVDKVIPELKKRGLL